MAIVKTLVFNSPIRSVVKLTGDGAATITLAELIDPLKKHMQDGPLKAHLGSVTVSQVPTSTALIVRGGVTIVALSGNAEIGGDIKMAEQETADIDVTLPTAATLLLEIWKNDGYTINMAGV